MIDNPRILVTGAGGFIGKAVVTKLLQRGWNVKAMLHNSSSVPFRPTEKLQLVRADLRDYNSLAAALVGVDVVVHLAAAKNDEPWSADVNVGGAERLVKACKAVGCERIINISSQSVKISRKGTYAETKSQADRIFANSDLDVTTLLPSVVYGEEKEGVFGAVLNFVKKFPLIPVLGDGRWICAPVYVSDVAGVICSCVERDQTVGKRYDIAGPDLITFDRFVDKVAEALGLRRRKIHIPFRAALFAARIIAALLPKPPITVSNVLGSNQDTHLDSTPASTDLGFDPIDLDTGLKTVLGDVSSGAAHEAPSQPPSDGCLAEECLVFARYLIDRDPPQELVDRYIAASRILFREEPLSQLPPELRFVHRHPLSLPFIDAAAGLFKPEGLVRKKLLLAAAILETTPGHADFFLVEAQNPFLVCVNLALQGLRSAVKIVLGIPVLWFAQRS